MKKAKAKIFVFLCEMGTNNDTFAIFGMEEDDFFAAMYSNSNMKFITVATFIIGAFIGLLSTVGIIWYERNGNHRCRTVINQLFSTLAWIVFWYIGLVYIPDGTRFLIGPLSSLSCEVIYLLKNFFFGCLLLTLDCIIFLRFTFIFKWTNFAVVNHDLIARFLNLSIAILGIWLATVKKWSIGRMPLVYFMCVGKNPNESDTHSDSNLSMTDKFNTTLLLVWASFALHVFVFTKIFLYEREMEERTENIQLGTLNPSDGNNGEGKRIAWSVPNNKTSGSPNLSKSMIDFTTQLLCLLAPVVFATVQLAAGQMMDVDELNEHKNRWYAYFQQIGTTVTVIGISVIYYLKNRVVFTSIWKNIRSQFQE